MAGRFPVVARVFAVGALALAACGPAPRAALPSPRPPARPAPEARVAPPTAEPPRPTAPAPPGRLLWRAPGTPVLVQGGVVYAADRWGSSLRAYDLRCRRDGGVCRPAWRASPGPWPGPPAAAGGRLFVPTERGVAFYEIPCPGRRCGPAGALRIPDPLIPGYPEPGRALGANVFALGEARGTLFVVAEVDLGEGSGIRAGRLLAYDPRCTPPCPPLWRSPPGRGLGLPTVRGDRVFLPGSSGLAAFARCPTDGSLCRPAWMAPMNTRRGLMTMRAAVTRRRSVIALTEGCVCGADSDAPMLAAFPARCSGRCRPAWSLRLPGRFAGGPAVLGGSVFASAAGVVVRVPLRCSPACAPTARYILGNPGSPRPLLSLGRSLVVATYRPNRVSALPARCEGRCEPSAVWKAPGPLRVATASRGRLLVAAGRTLTLLPHPRTGGPWEPIRAWTFPRGVGTVLARGGIAVVGAGGWTYAVRIG